MAKLDIFCVSPERAYQAQLTQYINGGPKSGPLRKSRIWPRTSLNESPGDQQCENQVCAAVTYKRLVADFSAVVGRSKSMLVRIFVQGLIAMPKLL